MRNRTVTLLKLVVMIFGAVWIMGCGSADPLDELPHRYVVTVSTTDIGETTRDVDMVQNDCDGEPEDFGDFGAVATITAANDTADLVVYGYTVYFTPRTGTYFASDGATPSSGTWTNMTPPPSVAPYTNLQPIVHNYDTPLVMQNGSLEDIDIHLWTPEAKYFFIYTVLALDNGLNGIFYDGTGTAVGIDAETIGFTYDFRVVLHCHDSEDGDFDLDAWDTAVLSDWDNC